jgi:hypothetical protein
MEGILKAAPRIAGSGGPGIHRRNMGDNAAEAFGGQGLQIVIRMF